jgi:crotonobetainyl-CoA hydratase
VVPLEKLMKTAIDLANRISVNGPLSVKASKRIAMGISDGAIASDAGFWEANNREGRIVTQSQDAKERPLAFAQKRQPVWQVK